MKRLLLALMLLGPVAAMAEPRPRGLMWNRSGQPLTLPLQIRSDPGADYFLTLTRPDAAEPAIAAYVRGGEFFRLLLPPGEWRIALVAGREWQGEAALFGPDTRRLGVDAVLGFRATGAARRDGHLIDLRAGREVIGDFALCRGGAVARRNADRNADRTVGGTAREAMPDVPPPPVPENLAAPRRAETRLPPPDQPPAVPEDLPQPFPYPFPDPPRSAIPRVRPPEMEPPRPTARIAQPAPRRNARWLPCD